MFRTKRAPDFSFARNSKKFFTDRDSIQRIKHLRSIIENVSTQELKNFFQKNYSLIFQSFFDVFSSVHMELQQKVNSSHYKELQNILAVLEKIFIYLPEQIKEKWQFNCICSIIKSLIHHSNIFRVRRIGMQLFLLWFQILDNNSPKVCHDIYISLLPIFESTILTKICPKSPTKLKSEPSLEEQSLVSEPEIKPVLTQNIDKDIEPEDDNLYLLRYLLRSMITETSKIEWTENSEQKYQESFSFLFDKFKEYYLPVIFPKCSSEYTLEKNQATNLILLDELKKYSVTHKNYPVNSHQIAIYQEEVIRWLAELTYNRTVINDDFKNTTKDSLKTTQSSKSFNIDNYLVKWDPNDGGPINISIIQRIQKLLFSSIDNINIINQLFQHALYLPITHYRAHYCTIFVYKSWLFHENRPSFMLVRKCRNNNNDNNNEYSEISSNLSSISRRNFMSLNDSMADTGHNTIAISLIMQRIIFSNVAIVFMHTYHTNCNNNNNINDNNNNNNRSPEKKTSTMNIHDDLVRKIMEHIYRKASSVIDNLDYQHLITVLLDIAWNVMTHYSPNNRPDNHWIRQDSSIGQFFQTLNVLLIKSNLTQNMPGEIWDKYLTVYSRLTNWSPLIDEWRKTIDLLVKMMARNLYGLDLNDLPLEKNERRGAGGNATNKTSVNDRSARVNNRTKVITRANPVNTDINYASSRQSAVITGRDESTNQVRMSNTMNFNSSTLERESSISTNTNVASATCVSSSASSVTTPNVFMDQLQANNNIDATTNVPSSSRDVPQLYHQLSVDTGVPGTGSTPGSSANTCFFDATTPQGSIYASGGAVDDNDDSMDAASSSHDDHSSYMSAEDSNSPNYQDKNINVKCEFPSSDNEAINQSSSGGDNSYEGCNDQYEIGESIKSFTGEVEIEADNNDDGDDEDESEGVFTSVNQTIRSDSKSGTLTREDSDIDLIEQDHLKLSKEQQQDDLNSRTPTRTRAKLGTAKHRSKSDRNSLISEIDYNSSGATSTLHSSGGGAGGSTGASLKAVDMRRCLSTDAINPHHVILGGTVVGWTDEAVVVLWTRCLGLLGNITHITNQNNLLSLCRYLSELTDVLIKIRKNMSASFISNSSVRLPPAFVPPIEDIVPWLFEILHCSIHNMKIKELTLTILCKITVRKHDIEPSIHHLSQFYHMIHSIVQSDNKPLICVAIQSIGINFFSQPLAGSEILILSLIKAVDIVLKIDNSKTSINLVPKIEAITLLSNILKFKTVYKTIKAFDPNSLETVIIESVIDKNHILDILLNCVKSVIELQPRILSVAVMHLYCYDQLQNHNSNISSSDNDPDDDQHQDDQQSISVIRQCILYLLAFTRMDNCKLASLAVDMIRVLVNCSPVILDKLPLIPDKIIQTLCWTLRLLWQHKRNLLNTELKRLFTSMIFCIVDWCMVLPLNQLLESNDYHCKGLVHFVFTCFESIINDGGSTGSAGANTDSSCINKVDSNRLALMHYSNDPLAEYSHLFDVLSVQDSTRNSSERLCYSEIYKIIRLSARTSYCHLINHIGQFPRNEMIGCMSCCVQEHHDLNSPMQSLDQNDCELPNNEIQSAHSSFEQSDNVQMFVINQSIILSLVAINSNLNTAPGGPPITNVANTSTEVRVIIRDLCGKYCWDIKYLPKLEYLPTNSPLMRARPLPGPNSTISPETDEENVIPPSPPPRRNLPVSSTNSAVVLTDRSNTSQHSSTTDNDQVTMLLEDLNTLSPELFCSSNPDSARRSSSNVSGTGISSVAQQLISNGNSSDINMHNLELVAHQQIIDQQAIELRTFDELHYAGQSNKINHPKLIDKKWRRELLLESPDHLNTSIPPNIYFCRQILAQLGFMSWKKRVSIDAIKKSKIYVHLKTLDQRRSRETHKIAVLYIRWGQEDKDSVLSNSKSSLEFNNFIGGLGWPVELRCHRGFMGGLEGSGRNGELSPYYCDSSVEVMFHVGTWMPTCDNPAKFKHIGNDEVMIIWSENYRDYFSQILRTQFADTTIIIYPLRNGLFSISIKCKKEQTRYFGPLFDGAIVGERELPTLIRATAINAGRVIREYKQHYLDYYVERAQYLDNAIQNFKVDSTYEDFVKNIYSNSSHSNNTQHSSINNNATNYDDLPQNENPSHYVDSTKVSTPKYMDQTDLRK